MKINQHNRKPINKRRFIQLLEQHLNDTGLMTGFAAPPFTIEEVGRAKFLAADVTAKLEKADGSRVRALATAMMYQSNVAGVVAFLKAPAPVAPPANVTPPPPPPTELGPTDAARVEVAAHSGTVAE